MLAAHHGSSLCSCARLLVSRTLRRTDTCRAQISSASTSHCALRRCIETRQIQCTIVSISLAVCVLRRNTDLASTEYARVRGIADRACAHGHNSSSSARRHARTLARSSSA